MSNKTRLGVAVSAAVLIMLGDVPAHSQPDVEIATRPALKMPRAARKRVAAMRVEMAGEGEFGAPLPGLTAEQLEAFEEGIEEFQSEDTAESGLGPTFNDVSCAACHSSPAVGGSSTKFVTRFGREEDGYYDPLTSLGGSLLQSQAIDPAAQEIVPSEANVVIQRRTTPLFGFGLIEAIPDRTIMLNADKNRNPEINGRPSMVTDVTTGEQRVGRFGWKAQQATLLAFAADAYLNEMGITSRFFPEENAPNGNSAMLAKYDTVADPEDQVDPATGRSDVDLFADFMRFLGAPPALPATNARRMGRLLFDNIGCSGCHTPLMYTGPNEVKALAFKPVPLYSDLLLHDMGSLADGIAQADAAAHEMRTSPLWGLRAQSEFLHDGRAKTPDEAIRMHDGEASGARDRYLGLKLHQQLQLLEFLNSI